MFDPYPVTRIVNERLTIVSTNPATLKPGGWLQVQEPDLSLQTWAHESSALADFVTILGAVLDKVGVGREFSVNLDDAFRKAGLKNVSVKEVKYPIGAKTASQENSRSSVESFLTTIETAVGSVKGKVKHVDGRPLATTSEADNPQLWASISLRQ